MGISNTASADPVLLHLWLDYFVDWNMAVILA